MGDNFPLPTYAVHDLILGGAVHVVVSWTTTVYLHFFVHILHPPHKILAIKKLRARSHDALSSDWITHPHTWLEGCRKSLPPNARHPR